MKLSVKILDGGVLPARAFPDDAGLDLRAAGDTILFSGAQLLVRCGIACREADRKRERVEPHGAARPGRHGPAELPLTPQDPLPAARVFVPGLCP